MSAVSLLQRFGVACLKENDYWTLGVLDLDRLRIYIPSFKTWSSDSNGIDGSERLGFYVYLPLKHRKGIVITNV